MMRFVLVLSLLVGLVALSLPGQHRSARAAFPGANGKIAFSRGIGDDGEIYVMDADGRNQTNITNNSWGDYSPKWSPDGARILFATYRNGNSDIYLMNADGSDVTPVITGDTDDSDPTWAPDGTRLAFLRSTETGLRIHVANLDGTQDTDVSNGPYGDRDPDWSPDGSRIVYISWRSNLFGYEVYTMNPDGTDEVRETRNEFGVDSNPTWSPDGHKIAFAHNPIGSGNFIVTFDPATGSARVLEEAGEHTGSPSWSPDGHYLAYGVFDRETNSREIWRMHNDGSARVRLTHYYPYDADPDWQPRPAGDVNCASGVDSLDALLELQALAGLTDTLVCEDRADVDGDGDLDALDAALILQFAAGLLDGLPV